MGWKEVPKPLLTFGGDVALKTSASMSTNGVGFCEVEAAEGEAKPRRSALWLLLLWVEWFPTELRAGLFRSLGVAPSLPPGAPGSATRPGFFFFNIAKIEDSRSGNGGISSKTVACIIKKKK